MTPEWVLQKLRGGSHLATVIPSSHVDRTGWVGVYPLDQKKEGTKALLRRFGLTTLKVPHEAYRIRAFEISNSTRDGSSDISEDDLVVVHDIIAVGDDDLVVKLASLSVQIAQLDLPFKCDYPI